MGGRARGEDTASARETLHELMNALAAARVWLTVLGNTPPAEREAALADALVRINRSIAQAEACCQQLREQRPATPPPRRRRK